jgi:hypothetical protein
MEAQEQERGVQSAKIPAFDVGGDTMREEARIRRKVIMKGLRWKGRQSNGG